MNNNTIFWGSLLFSGITYFAMFISFVDRGTILPDNLIGGGFAILGAIVAPIVCYISISKENDLKVEEEYQRKVKLNELSNTVPGFRADQKYYSFDENTMLLIDEKYKKFCIYPIKKNPKVYKYRDILKSEIIQDDVSVTTTDRRSSLGGALLGGILAGGVGALIGGLSGKQETQQKVKYVDLQIVVNDIKEPVHSIRFMDSMNGLSKESSIYEKAVKQANHCHNLLSVLIKQADEADEEENKTNEAPDKEIQEDINTTIYKEERVITSIGDELSKLVSLKESGILTDDEYIEAKKKVLAQ